MYFSVIGVILLSSVWLYSPGILDICWEQIRISLKFCTRDLNTYLNNILKVPIDPTSRMSAILENGCRFGVFSVFIVNRSLEKKVFETKMEENLILYKIDPSKNFFSAVLRICGLLKKNRSKHMEVRNFSTFES